jgi:hypothetical protein
VNRPAHSLAAALWAVTVFAAAYLLQGALHLPAVVYDPAAHSWLLTSSLNGVQMRYYSDFGGAALAGCATGWLRFRWKAPPGDLGVLVGAALSVVALDLAWFLSRVLSALRS